MLGWSPAVVKCNCLVIGLTCLFNLLRSFGALLSTQVVADVVYVLSELVLTSSKFMAQFYESKGLVALDAIDCFSCDGADDHRGDQQANVGATVSALQIASQLARNSENYFGQLLATFTPPVLAALLQTVRISNCLWNLTLHF